MAMLPPSRRALLQRVLEQIRGDLADATRVVAEPVSTDDGYASAKGRDEAMGMGVKALSISGAKGKTLTSSDD